MGDLGHIHAVAARPLGFLEQLTEAGMDMRESIALVDGQTQALRLGAQLDRVLLFEQADEGHDLLVERSRRGAPADQHVDDQQRRGDASIRIGRARRRCPIDEALQGPCGRPFRGRRGGVVEQIPRDQVRRIEAEARQQRQCDDRAPRAGGSDGYAFIDMATRAKLDELFHHDHHL